METTPKHPRFVRWALMLGIVIILNIFFTVLVSLALPEPNYAAYCPAAASNAPVPQDAADCTAANGVWTDTTTAPSPAGSVQPLGYCDLTANCQTPYLNASNTHDLYAFIFMIGLGIIALIIGFVPIGSSIVSSGLSYGGVVALIIASAEYWDTANEWLRLGIALAGLAALLYIGWRRFKD